MEVGAAREYFFGYPNEDYDLRYKAWMWLHDQQKSDLLDTLTLEAAPNHPVEPLVVLMQSSSTNPVLPVLPPRSSRRTTGAKLVWT